MESLEQVLGISAVVLLLALLAIRFARKIGMPSLLLYLGIGVLLGNAGFGIEFGTTQQNTLLTEQIGFGALVFILAEGGLSTRWSRVRPALGLGIALSTVSVVVSVAVVGVGVHVLMGFDWRTSFLWGAVLSSTDAAAVFSVLRGVGVKRRLAAALELESGFNDAPVVIAVLLLASNTAISWTAPFLVLYELLAGAAIGAVLGYVGAWWLRRGALPSAGLYPLATVALICGSYAVGQFAHSSGFMATYVTALWLGNAQLPHRVSTASFAEALGWIAQIGLFVMLGLYVDPTRLPAALGIGVVLGLFVLLVARPLSVIAAATPFRVPWREQAMLSWSGLRGAVPIVLAMIPLFLRGGRDENSRLLIDVVIIIVIIYTLIQGTSLPWVARKLGAVDASEPTEVEVDAAPLEEMKAQLLQIKIPEGSRLHGVYVNELRLPKQATVSLVLRAGVSIPVTNDTRLQSGDQMLVVVPEKVLGITERRLRAVGRGGALASWFGEDGRRTDT
ncbi:potassium/proton antiporter [Nakamurella antarctica]|uniref:Potassium/proton antiporter n=1 Tax=Nakamurella antarctica TaxID=1902245 RepID=A0A3G8ZQA1_9ACTN|nr:potassium/proton antiporter [Nakamurella antarctica]AZI59440.1 potassium/proton antiporter [Nakamurella antarctica]